MPNQVRDKLLPNKKCVNLASFAKGTQNVYEGINVVQMVTRNIGTNKACSVLAAIGGSFVHSPAARFNTMNII